MLFRKVGVWHRTESVVSVHGGDLEVPGHVSGLTDEDVLALGGVVVTEADLRALWEETFRCVLDEGMPMLQRCPNKRAPAWYPILVSCPNPDEVPVYRASRLLRPWELPHRYY